MARINTGVNFYLKTPKAKASQIRAVFNYSYQRLMYTEAKLKIETQFWNPNDQRARNTKSFPGHSIFNDTLDKIELTILDAYRDYKNEFGLEPNVDTLLNIIKQKRGKNLPPVVKPIELMEFIENFIEDAKNGLHLNLTNGRSVSSVTIRTYEQTFKLLQSYAGFKKKELLFDDINGEFHTRFVNYLTKEYKSKETKQSFKINTVGKHLTNIKTFMSKALERKLTSNNSFRDRGFKVIHENIESIYLTSDEVTAFYNFDFSKDKKLERVRDMFIIGCDTGLRISDLKRLKNEHVIIDDGVTYIRIEMKKTEKIATIPTTKRVENIIAKYESMTGEFFPKSISDQKANDYIKEAASHVEELKKGVIYNTTVEGERKSMIIPKYDLITNHTSRRSFATNAILKGLSRDVVMKLTGHKTEKSFNRYLRMDERDLAKLHTLQLKELGLI